MLNSRGGRLGSPRHPQRAPPPPSDQLGRGEIAARRQPTLFRVRRAVPPSHSPHTPRYPSRSAAARRRGSTLRRSRWRGWPEETDGRSGSGAFCQPSRNEPFTFPIRFPSVPERVGSVPWRLIATDMLCKSEQPQPDRPSVSSGLTLQRDLRNVEPLRRAAADRDGYPEVPPERIGGTARRTRKSVGCRLAAISPRPPMPADLAAAAVPAASGAGFPTSRRGCSALLSASTFSA